MKFSVRSRRNRKLRRLVFAGLAVAFGLGAGSLLWLLLSHRSGGHLSTTAARVTARPHVDQGGRVPSFLVPKRTGTLIAPVQDEAIAALDSRRAMLLGGLTAADSSTDAILIATKQGAHATGRLPQALHDAAAARLGSSVFLFGGGTGSSQLDAILRVTAEGNVLRVVGHLPAPSSDQAAAPIGNTAYVVGGYTGSRWLDTIVAWHPGGRARVVARLPHPLRYAAVTAAAGRLVIAGGSLENGTASAAVFEYLPSSGSVRRLGRLPEPTTHAAAAAINHVAYVIGGRGARVGSAKRTVVAIDLVSGRIRVVARLPTAVSDAGAVTLGRRILVAGGRTKIGVTAAVLTLAPRKPTAASRRAPAAASAARSRQGRAATNVYAADAAGLLTGAARHARSLVYVPNSLSNTVDVIDPHSYKVVAHFAVGLLPQHVTPSWDLKTLYVLNDAGNSLMPIDPTTGKPGRAIAVDDPYNMYFVPSGRSAIVVAERLHRLDFRDPHNFRLHHSLRVPCAGVDHLDFSADGSYLVASCEFSGQMLKVDVASERITGVLRLPDGTSGMPQDVKLAPDGAVFYVADMKAGGLWEIDGRRFRVIGFLPTGTGVHGLYPSRDGRLLYATNRGEGSISVISFATRRVLSKWRIPGGGSPDMGGISADGKVLWLSGRFNNEVYALSTTSGKLLARIPVGRGPHGLCVWPQPGRYSLGHTGILR